MYVYLFSYFKTTKNWIFVWKKTSELHVSPKTEQFTLTWGSLINKVDILCLYSTRIVEVFPSRQSLSHDVRFHTSWVSALFCPFLKTRKPTGRWRDSLSSYNCIPLSTHVNPFLPFILFLVLPFSTFWRNRGHTPGRKIGHSNSQGEERVQSVARLGYFLYSYFRNIQ